MGGRVGVVNVEESVVRPFHLFHLAAADAATGGGAGFAAIRAARIWRSSVQGIASWPRAMGVTRDALS